MPDTSKQIDQIQEILTGILKSMGITARVEIEESIIKGLIFNISSPDSYLLIGKQGNSLHALQILTQALVSRALPKELGPFWFTLDVDDYKRKREWYLKETAKTAAENCKRSGKPVALEPMPNYERRLIHTYLQDTYPEISTLSSGADPYRRIIVKTN